MIQTIQLQGTEPQLYQLLAPLVMDPDVLRKNNNYPFKTTPDYIWFVAMDEQRVLGFMPVEKRYSHLGVINNYYADEREEEVLMQLITAVISAFGDEKELHSVTLTKHLSIFTSCGFKIEKEWKRYIKMRRI